MLDTPPKDKSKGICSSKNENWKVSSSEAARNCKNYIRDIVDNMTLEPNPEKQVIALSIGDPTVYGNLRTSQDAIQGTIDAIQSGGSNGYAPCAGFDMARQTVAEYLSFDGVEYRTNDIILCSGCSHALDLCIAVLVDATKGQNLLIPKPGFPIYRTLAECMGIPVKNYNLLPESNWKVDLNHLEAQIDESTCAIVVNNPSNPCGSVYEEDHLRDILEIAARYKIPVIADEIYERLVFPERRFTSMAALDSGVPLLVCGGLAKRFLVPGWRVGWIAIHDPIGAFDPEIRKGLSSLSQRIIGCNTIIQAALPNILRTPQSFHDDLINTLYENAKFAFEELSKIGGLKPMMPDGTMYMMVQIHIQSFEMFNTGLDFMQRLMEEESVFCLPGECFGMPGFMRIVLTVPMSMLTEACQRIAEFCDRHCT